MRCLTILGLSISIAGLSGVVVAGEKAFTGVFEGTGRGCSGALYVRAKTIEWNSTYSLCKATHYEVLEAKKSDVDYERIVFQLKKPSSQCRYSVIEVEHASGYNWNVSGYQSLEGFKKKDLPDWRNSALPERQILSCLMTGLD